MTLTHSHIFDAVRNPMEMTIHSLFEKRAAEFPRRTALVWRAGEISYERLNGWANVLAHRLIERGVGRGSIVGLMSHRSPGMLAGMLAIFKAGAAYLPIDWELPVARKEFLFKDSCATVLLTQRALVEKDEQLIESLSGENVLYLDAPPADSREVSPEDLVNPVRAATPRDAAYVLYTSGSTGRPKGTVIEHFSTLNLLASMQHRYPLGKGNTFLLKTSISFDVSVSELFGWFVGGGRLALLSQGGEKEPHRILEAVERFKVTHISFAPAMFNVFLDILEPEDHGALESLKYLFVAGEALLPELAEKYARTGLNARLENLYGPTEATVYTTGYALKDWPGGDFVPIGVPFPNVELFIIDSEGNEVKEGETGELCIAGAGLARGYLNNPQLTADTFIQFVPKRNKEAKRTDGAGQRGNKAPYEDIRIYKTGDLASRMPDGNIRFLGRRDHQVKIRGIRIELGEIENCLLKRGDIKEAAVTVIENAQKDKRVCAYVVRNDGGGRKQTPDEVLDKEALIESLREELPDYMIPSAFVQLKEMPLTVSGKINRKALPVPEIENKTPYVAPRDEIEEYLAQAWADTLAMPVDKIGGESRFSELGGHSLKAAVLAQRIHKTFDVRLSMTDIFNNLTIQQMAELIGGSAREKFIAVEPVEEREYYPVSAAQSRIYILNQMAPDSLNYNMPGMYPLEGDVRVEQLEELFRHLMQRHEAFRTSFHIMNRQAVQRIHREVPFKVDYYSTPPSASLFRPFDPGEAPLLRVALIRGENGQHSLAVDMHHIIGDGVSQDILIDDFLTLYKGGQLEPLRLRYRDYAMWQERQRQSGQLDKQADYWKREFSGQLPKLEIPADFPRPPVKSDDGRTTRFLLEPAVSARLRRYAVEDDASRFMVVLTVFSILLAKLSGQEDVIVGTVTAGRRHPDLQGIVGIFINSVALRMFPAREKTFRQLLLEVKERTLQAFDNQDYQFEDLVQALLPVRDPSRNPLFDVLFSFNAAETPTSVSAEDMGQPDEPGEVAGDTRAKFDLTLTGFDVGRVMGFIVEYCKKLYKDETVRRFIDYFKEIAAAVTEDKHIKIRDITLSHQLAQAGSTDIRDDEDDFGF